MANSETRLVLFSEDPKHRVSTEIAQMGEPDLVSRILSVKQHSEKVATEIAARNARMRGEDIALQQETPAPAARSIRPIVEQMVPVLSAPAIREPRGRRIGTVVGLAAFAVGAAVLARRSFNKRK